VEGVCGALSKAAKFGLQPHREDTMAERAGEILEDTMEGEKKVC
jgi:hypothetical protein